MGAQPVIKSKTARKACIAFASALLAISYIGTGLGLCIVAPTMFGNVFVDTVQHEDSPYTHDALAALADDIYAYAITDHRNYGNPSYVVAGYVQHAALVSMDSAEKANLWSTEARKVLERAQPESGASFLCNRLYEISPDYCFAWDVIPDLDELNETLAKTPILVPTGMIFIALLVVSLLITCGKTGLGAGLVVSGSLTLAFAVALYVCFSINPEAIPSWLASTLPEGAGSSFPKSGLFARLFPQAFWWKMQMGWAITSCIPALAGMAVGAFLLRAKRGNAQFVRKTDGNDTSPREPTAPTT